MEVFGWNDEMKWINDAELGWSGWNDEVNWMEWWRVLDGMMLSLDEMDEVMEEKWMEWWRNLDGMMLNLDERMKGWRKNGWNDEDIWMKWCWVWMKWMKWCWNWMKWCWNPASIMELWSSRYGGCSTGWSGGHTPTFVSCTSLGWRCLGDLWPLCSGISRLVEWLYRVRRP